MAHYTSAYLSFVARLSEVEMLCRLASAKEKIDPVEMRNEINALCRGSIVLLSSHLEAYIRELGEVTLECMHTKAAVRNTVAAQFFYHLSRDIIQELRDTSEPDRIAGKVFSFIQRDLSYWNRTGPFPLQLPSDRFNMGFSNPSFEKIKSYFNRFGYSGYQDHMARALRANYFISINMVNHLVDTRNKIAHGDITTTKTPKDVKDMMKVIQKFCASTDNVFARWCKIMICPIK